MRLLVAALAAFFVLAISAPAADNLSLSVVSETEETVTLGWNPPAGANSYTFWAGGVRVSNTQNGARSSVKFGRAGCDAEPGCYIVVANTELAAGSYPVPAPPPPPPATTISGSECSSRAATSGAVIENVVITGGCQVTAPNVTIRNVTTDGAVQFMPGGDGGSLLDSHSDAEFYIYGADNVLIEGNVFDGHGRSSGVKMWDKPAGDPPSGWVIRDNVFRNFYQGADSSKHTQALYVGYSTDGLIEGNTFTKNGNTAHIFFTWFGNEANPSTSYPRRICVRGNTFNERAGAFYDVNMRDEIPLSADITIQRGIGLDRDEFHGDC